jgi:cobalt/nickel transport protein
MRSIATPNIALAGKQIVTNPQGKVKQALTLMARLSYDRTKRVTKWIISSVTCYHLKNVKNLTFSSVIAISALFWWVPISNAHFQGLIPSDDMVTKSDGKTISVDILFFHPFEGHYMNMDRPATFGVMVRGRKTDLLGTLKEKKIDVFSAWEAKYRVRTPGDHILYVEPKPYWEPTEDCFIVHYTKVVVNSLGVEEGWDEEVGLKTEIVPLTRPYGLWTGNVFQGIVKVNGEPAPGTRVEVEYYNEGGRMKAPADPMITQVIKADPNGVFTYAMPKAGWWAFAALNTDERKMKYEDQEKSVEIGAVLWVRVHDMK